MPEKKNINYNSQSCKTFKSFETKHSHKEQWKEHRIFYRQRSILQNIDVCIFPRFKKTEWNYKLMVSV